MYLYHNGTNYFKIYAIFYFQNYSCCQENVILTYVPTRCFESNRCYGLHWLGKEACSKTIRDAILQPRISISTRNNLNYENYDIPNFNNDPNNNVKLQIVKTIGGEATQV